MQKAYMTQKVKQLFMYQQCYIIESTDSDERRYVRPERTTVFKPRFFILLFVTSLQNSDNFATASAHNNLFCFVQWT